jgi:shikimate kinase
MEPPPDAIDVPARHVVLAGLMGCGKTTVGRSLAARLGRPLHDSDVVIEAREGRTVRAIRAALGTVALHELEARTLRDALAAPGPDVICAAASTADDDACLAALATADVAVVWLRVRPATAAARFRSGAHRPWYGTDPAVFLARQAAARAPRFAAVATLGLDTDDLAPDELADAILAGLAGGPVRQP